MAKENNDSEVFAAFRQANEKRYNDAMAAAEASGVYQTGGSTPKPEPKTRDNMTAAEKDAMRSKTNAKF